MRCKYNVTLQPQKINAEVQAWNEWSSLRSLNVALALLQITIDVRLKCTQAMIQTYLGSLTLAIRCLLEVPAFRQPSNKSSIQE